MSLGRSLLLLCLALAAAQAFAVQAAAGPAPNPDVSITASVDRSTIHVGDLINCTVTVKWADSDEVEPPSAVDMGPFVVRDYRTTDIRKEDGFNVLGMTYTITTYETGQLQIPPFRAVYKDADGSQKVLRTESIGVNVLSMNPDIEGEPKDIKPPARIHAKMPPWMRKALLGLAALVVAAGLAYLGARKIKRKREKIEAPKAPPHELALRRLDELSSAGLETTGQRKAFVFELSEIMREYIEGLHKFPALEMTSDELAAELPQYLTEPWPADLSDRFSDWDLVKFAKHDIEAVVLRGDLDLVRRLVLETMPKPEPAEEADQQASQPGRDEAQGSGP